VPQVKCPKGTTKESNLSQMFCSDELNILKSSRCRKVYATVKSQL